MLRIDNSVATSIESCLTAPRGRRARSARRGFTLLEVMIATAVTLLMMISLAQIFKVIGDSMKQGRSVLELNNRLRNVVYRIRTDLDNLTAIPNPPADPSAALGYLQVYDGPTTDFSMAWANPAQNRVGDVDDIIMATVRAGDVWFTGKVPLFVLKGVVPDISTDVNGNGVADDLESVSIAAEHAEVAIFTQPLVASSRSGFAYTNPQRNPGYMVAAPGFFQDDDANGFPDAFRLHYRVLLIRPDLNLSTNNLLPGSYPYFIAGPQSGVLPDAAATAFTVPTPLCDMSAIHGLCDLSVRRVFDPSDGLSGTRDYIAANSLEDLVDPANRFAHVQVPLPGTSSTTMPLLALGPKLTPTFTNNPYAAYPDGTLGTSNFEVGCGFLHPAFTLQGPRAGEDVLSSDILAFDVKLYDATVPLLGTWGADGFFGTSADDDGDGNPSNPAELGWAGSDDLILSPNDPGYNAALNAPAGVSAVGMGDYVDISWAKKLVTHGGTISATTNVWSALSGYSLGNLSNGVQHAYTDFLYKSGAVLRLGTTSYVIQPSYDTWTQRYEGDGILQSFRGTLIGNVRIAGATSLYGIGSSDVAAAVPTWRQSAFDAATDGIDQGGPGVDDITEFETSPPFPFALRGLKISVRMEDPLTRQVKQMSAAKEFVTQ